MAGKLSFLQEQALIALHRRQHFGLDSRAIRGLIVRGFVRLGYYNATFASIPFLTEAGAPIAAELEAEDRRRHCERRMRGSRFGVIEGARGCAPVELGSTHQNPIMPVCLTEGSNL